MAGNGSRAGSGRAAGGGTKASGGAGAPPKPSAMKVNLFQQASREARQQAQRSAMRTERGSAAVQEGRGNFGYQRGVAKRERSNRTFIRAGLYQAGDAAAAPNPRIMTRTGRRRGESRGFRFPSTRLY